MRYLHILCEGQTEEAVARDVMEPYFDPLTVQVRYSTYKTKRPAGGPAFKGGLSRWPKLERELRLLLRNSSTTVLTTMFDYYAFPADAPGMADRPHGTPHDRVRHVESVMAKAIGDTRFFPNLVPHQATFARSTMRRSRSSYAWLLRQMMYGGSCWHVLGG